LKAGNGWITVGERLQRSTELDGQHEFAHDLGRTRSDQRRADQHPLRAVADQLDDRERQPTVANAGRNRFACDATPETHDVELLGHVAPFVRR